MTEMPDEFLAQGSIWKGVSDASYLVYCLHGVATYSAEGKSETVVVVNEVPLLDSYTSYHLWVFPLEEFKKQFRPARRVNVETRDER